MYSFEGSNYSQAQNLSPSVVGMKLQRPALSKHTSNPPEKYMNLQVCCQHPPRYQSILNEHDPDIFF